jgi:hypothetical protein
LADVVEMMDLSGRYMYAERSADWVLHIKTVQEMLPYLISAGVVKRNDPRRIMTGGHFST